MSADDDNAMVELRQYTLYPGARETLVDLFDRELVESQEACGACVIGRLRDLDRHDRRVWLRGIADMPARSPLRRARGLAGKGRCTIMHACAAPTACS